mgnify:CR=1 FL=1
MFIHSIKTKFKLERVGFEPTRETGTHFSNDIILDDHLKRVDGSLLLYNILYSIGPISIFLLQISLLHLTHGIIRSPCCQSHIGK